MVTTEIEAIHVRRSIVRRAAAFTLIEMLIVLAIIALLLTIAVPRYFNSLDRAREVTLQEDLKVMRVTLDKFYADKGRFPDSLGELVDQKYLRDVPVDPITESNNSWLLINSPDPALKGIVDVKSGAPGLSADGRTFSSF